MEVVKTTCMVCNFYCGLDVWKNDGRIINVTGMQESPANDICVKGKALPEWVHSDERITNPLIRLDGVLEETTWDIALQYIADKLYNLKSKYGAKTLVVNTGNPVIRTIAGC